MQVPGDTKGMHEDRGCTTLDEDDSRRLDKYVYTYI
jgi:hypothetical protein